MIDPALPLAATAFSGFDSVWDFFKQGGIFMIPLVMTCIVGLMAIVFKFLSLTEDRVVPTALSRNVANYSHHLANDSTATVIREFQEGKSSLARLGSVAVKHAGKPREQVTAAVEAAAREESVHLHSGIGVLDVVITIAPLLGLVGTASGLVVIFEGLGDSSDHQLISRGIAEALSTTIFGIAIAVPAVIAHSYFFRRIEKLTARLEGLMSDLAHTLAKPEV